MSSIPALDRTVALLGGDLFPTLDPDRLAHELTSLPVVLAADRANLSAPSGQTALVTAFIAIAQCGLKIYLEIPEMAMINPQPPLRGPQLRAGLMDLASDLITPASLAPPPPLTPQVLIGDSTPRGDGQVLRIGGDGYRAELCLGVNSRVGRIIGAEPFGAILAGIAAAAEVMRIAVAELRDRHGLDVSREFDLEGPRDVTLGLPSLAVPQPLDLGAVDFISAGAITNACLFALLRVSGLTAAARVIDADRGEVSNLNRYALLRRSNLGIAKVDILAAFAGPTLSIRSVELQLDADTVDQVQPLSPSVVCGVDDIPSRWLVQGLGPSWLCVGGTSHFTTLVSEHVAGMPCAGCLHPEDDLEAPMQLPTISFTSMLAGTLQAYRLLAHATGSQPTAPLLGASFNLGAPFSLEEIGLAARADCPVRCRESVS